MKKTYFAPEVEAVDIDMFQALLAGSVEMDLSDDSEIDKSGDILAPEMDLGF